MTTHGVHPGFARASDAYSEAVRAERAIAIHLRRDHGLSYRKIGETLGLPVRAVKVLLGET